jgi:hypothetical protein
MSTIGTRPRSRLYAAGLTALVLASPAGLTAQNDTQDRAEEEAAIAHADSVRAALVQPPGTKHSTTAAIVRAPFRAFTGALAVVGGVAYGAYKLLDHIGAVSMVKDMNRSFEAADMKVRPDFIANRSGVGLTARWNGSGTPLFLEGGYSIRGYHLARGGLSFGDTLYGLELAAGHHKLTQMHFWGIGPDASADDRSDFGYTMREAGGAGHVRLLPHVRVAVGGGWQEYTGARGTDNARPDLQDTFAGDLPFGAVGTERFAHVDGQLDLDFTSLVRGERLGGVRALAGWSAYRGVSETDADFNLGSGDLRAYVPISQRHELALRGLAMDAFGEQGNGVPLYLLPRLGSSEGLRGQKGWRYRDRAVIAAMAEWRYQVWWHPGDPDYRVDAFVFTDHGAVGSSLGDIEGPDYVTTPGIGLRFLDKGIAQVETFVAFGGDAPRAGLKLRASF